MVDWRTRRVWVFVAALPCLLGGVMQENPEPLPCPSVVPPDEAVDATIVAVEHPAYSCHIDKHLGVGAGPPRCLDVQSGECNFDVHGPDGSTRSGHTSGGRMPLGWEACDLPPGTYQLALCTPAGSLPCTVEVAADDQLIQLHPQSSLPMPDRYRAKTAAGELTFDSTVDLVIGSHRRLVLRRDPQHPIPQLGRCDIAEIPSSPPVRAHGCAGCDAGDADRSSLALLAFVAVGWTISARRRSP